jgi:hypothetical protein
LNCEGISFITLRRRSPKMLRQIVSFRESCAPHFSGK